jgi:hypothetical protein
LVEQTSEASASGTPKNLEFGQTVLASHEDFASARKVWEASTVWRKDCAGYVLVFSEVKKMLAAV